MRPLPRIRRAATPSRLLVALVAALALAAAGLGGAAAPAQVGAPQLPTTPATPGGDDDGRPAPVTRLDNGWSRAPDPDDVGLQENRPLGGGTGWQPVSVPDVADPSVTRESYRGSIWWYGRQVAVPEASPGGTWALRFEGVRREATVYANGQEIGRNDDPYAPFEVELPDELAGRVVAVAVRVDGRRPPRTSEGWWNWAGIVRPVALVPRGRVTTTDAALQGDARCIGVEQCTTSVRVRADVRNRTAEGAPTVARVRVTDPGGKEVASAERDLGDVPAGGTRALSLDLPVPDGRLWTPSDPTLYRASVDLVTGAGTSAERVEQVVSHDVGLRGVTVRGGRMLLNGRVLRLRGASIQEDLPGRGAALSDADVERIVRDLREVGANVTRAHYSLDERLLSALDRVGIMVWEQAPVYHADGKLDTRAGRERARRTNRASVLATRNHPSVIVHSVANELSPVADRRRGTRTYLAGARRDAVALDPTVPVGVDLLSYPGYPSQRAYRAFPVLGVNTYFGWYDGRDPPHSTKRLRDLRPFLARTRRAYPTSAIAVTEMGAEGVRSGSASRKGTLQFQARYLRQTMDVLDDRDDLSGAIYWTMREFAVKPRWTGGTPSRLAKRDGIHRKALLTYAGERKPVWAVARQRLDGAVWGEGIDPDDEDSGVGAPVAGGITADGAVATLLVVLLLGWLGRVLWWDAVRAGGRGRRIRTTPAARRPRTP